MEKMISKLTAAKGSVQKVLRDNRGFSHTVEVVLIIVLVVAVLGAVFAPQIVKWFTQTVMPSLSTATTSLFNFKG